MDTLIHKTQKEAFNKAYKHALYQLKRHTTPTSSILITEESPLAFFGTLAACIECENPLFLGNPLWRDTEWQQVAKQLQPNIVFGKAPQWSETQTNLDLKEFRKTIMIPTGGTSGKIRFAIHTQETLKSSAKATIALLNNNPLSSYCTLPPYHISGLMPFIRAFYSGGQICHIDLKKLQSGLLPPSIPNATLSLVPTQLKRLLEYKHCIQWLKQLKCIFIGGAPASKTLLQSAKDKKIPLYLTYGLTETASMVSALHKEDFLKGHFSAGKPLSHAEIIIKPSQQHEKRGNIHLKASSLFKGYFPQKVNISALATQDEGFIDEEGNFHILGRKDDIVITGGKKVGLWEINELLQTLGYFDQLYLTTCPDHEWGTKIVALYSLKDSTMPITKIKMLLKTKIESHKIPKRWIPVESLPCNEKGKIDRKKLQALLSN